MRLKPSDQKKITKTLLGFLPEKSRIYLFGSRTRDEARGGDIDLLCVLSSSDLVSEIKKKKREALEVLKKDVGDRRIDLRFCVDSDFDKDPFLQSIREQMIELK